MNLYLYLKGVRYMPAVFENINYESLALFGKFGGAMLGLLLLVWLIAVLTPKAAKLIDGITKKKPSPERVEDNLTSENDYKVYSVFEDRPKADKNNTKSINDSKNTESK